MRIYLFFLLFAAAVWGCGDTPKKVELKDLVFKCTISEPQEGEKLLVTINEREQAFDVPANGIVEIKVPRIAPQYSGITYGRKYYPLYLAGGEPVIMEFSGNATNWKRTFSGNCKEINEYLSSAIAPLESSSFSKDEEELKKESEKVLARNIKNLEGKSLPEDFVKTEKERLRYYVYGSWNTYRMNHRWMAGDENFEPSEVYYATMRELAKENTDLVGLKAYRRFVQKAVEVMAGKGESDITPDKLIEREVKYIIDNYKDSTLLSGLIHHYIFDYVSDHGAGEKEELVTYYKQYVKDKKLLEDFDQVCATWSRLKLGDPSPEFNFADAKGDFVSLESLRGKFVYIDLWASWCGPCRREIPYLKALEKKFEGKPITFVSISCDNDAEAWRKAMEEENVSGIQLHMNGDLAFAKAYVVSGIPRFILLDKEGRIVDAHMTMPSDPNTEKTLQSFLEMK